MLGEAGVSGGHRGTRTFQVVAAGLVWNPWTPRISAKSPTMFGLTSRKSFEGFDAGFESSVLGSTGFKFFLLLKSQC